MRWLTGTLSFVAEILAGCRHQRVTRPFTIEQHTYEVCLDCGRQIHYSAERMRPLTAGEVRRMRAAQSGSKVVPLTARVRSLVSARLKSREAA